ncbi:MAG: DUF4492 domain-containing protein [Breznakibacter sp.]|nr:DUF4492 domain-containing protein [Breznakibacter sp.]
MKRSMKAILNFYLEGFRTLTSTSKTLWLIIFVKLFIMFFILKLFFFPNFLKSNFTNDSERANHVIESLIK